LDGCPTTDSEDDNNVKINGKKFRTYKPVVPYDICKRYTGFPTKYKSFIPENYDDYKLDETTNKNN
jgi:hypothetical protein